MHNALSGITLRLPCSSLRVHTEVLVGSHQQEYPLQYETSAIVS